MEKLKTVLAYIIIGSLGAAISYGAFMFIVASWPTFLFMVAIILFGWIVVAWALHRAFGIPL
jgi:hypothetical protein